MFKLKGKIIRMVIEKNFGFLIDDSKKEYFFHRDDFTGHWSDLCHDWNNGKKIDLEFDSVKNPDRGPRAANVERIDFPNVAR